VEARAQAAHTSRIAGWAGYGLDARPDGSPVKPDCFYMEASKPPARVRA
jgi:hypothetical protein